MLPAEQMGGVSNICKNVKLVENNRAKKGYEEGSKVHTFIDELKIAPLRDEARCVVAALGI